MDIIKILFFAVWIIFIIVFAAVKVSMPKMKNRTAKQIKNDAGYDDDGYDARGFSPLGFHRNGSRYDDDGYDRYGNKKSANED